ncbi:DUF3501 family protein [Sneathiella sp. HT1-7]|jgi:hypothetical protein|uniref:DUF3501 family protein n=1 Tax=Sneathiella sp. HT1-7 TaxID=2887192 RepID=UPI001D14D803|nr:DUF3501 family protein [Sneathiella sp. HT1-7]MCC3303796.1 DUF3501 family protein [Sneathiella sp. HT1-7]
MTAAQKREITPEDILPLAEYQKIRKEHKQKLIPIKKNRRVEIGPFATFYFENYDTMWSQIQEMLYIEQGGDEQLKDELEAYNPLIPNGSELVATLMIEIDDPVRRDFMLRQLGHIERTIYLSIGGEKIYAVPEEEVERTTDDGKASSIHFLHFPLTETQKAAFKDPATEIQLGIEHENYGHIALIKSDTRTSLAEDLSA